MPEAVEMVSLQTFNLRSLSGHTRSIKARQPVMIPPDMVEEAMARGMVPTSEAGIPLSHSRATPERKVVPTGLDREIAIMRKMEEYISREKAGEQGLFTGSGAPNAKTMTQELGFQISTKERNKLWTKFRQHGIPEPETKLELAPQQTSKPKPRSAPVVTGAGDDASDMSLDQVLESTGMGIDDSMDGAFSKPPSD